MSTQLERYQVLSQALAASFAAGTLPEPTDALKASLVVSQQGYDTPDEFGNVALLGLDPNSHYGKLRYAIKEVSDTLPRGSLARITSYYNCWNSNGSFGLYTECRKVVETPNPVFGSPTYMLGDELIPNALGLPFNATVASATEHFKNLPDPVTNDSFPHP